MSPKKEELVTKIIELQGKYDALKVNYNTFTEKSVQAIEEWKKSLELERSENENATKIIKDLRKEVAELKAELAKSATKQGTTSDKSLAINDEPMPLGSPSTINENVSSPPEAPTAQVVNKDKKVPAPEPITVQGVADFNIFQQAILSNLTTVPNLPVFSTLGNGSIKIRAACVDSYRQILSLLKKMQDEAGTKNEQDTNDLGKIEYHCYKLKQERNYCFIIRGLHPTTNLQRIKDALFQQGYRVCHMVNLRKRIKSADGNYSYKQLPLHRVEIISTEHNKEVFDIKELLYTKVTMEAPRKTRDIPQCVRCQQLGHTKNYCAIAQRCVKCAGNHWTKECKKPIDAKPTCANCRGEHPANYKGCPVYKKKQEALNPKQKKVTQRMQKKQWQPAKLIAENLSYAKAAATGTSMIPTANRYQQLAQQQHPEPTQYQAQHKKQQKQLEPKVPKKQIQATRQSQQQGEHQNCQKQSKLLLPKKQQQATGQPQQQTEQQKQLTLADIALMLTSIKADISQLHQLVSAIENNYSGSPQQQGKRKRDG